jgi:hypothetical protein
MLAGPILTPVVFLEDKAFSAKWPALPGRPRLRSGSLFVGLGRPPATNPSSTAQRRRQIPRRLPKSATSAPSNFRDLSIQNPRPSSSPPASQHPPEQSIYRSRRLAQRHILRAPTTGIPALPALPALPIFFQNKRGSADSGLRNLSTAEQPSCVAVPRDRNFCRLAYPIGERPNGRT